MRFKSRSRALAASALAASLGLAGLGLVAPAAQASEPTEATRIEGLPTYEGGTRYETAAEAATTAYPTGSDNVILASGEKFPDALAGGGLAGQLDAPILLTLQDQLPESTIEALAALDPTTVTIVGESEAVSDAVEAELVALGYGTDRIGGADRFETAALIAEELDGTTAVLANGLKFPDALAISPGAHALELPLLLTTADTLHEDAAAYIDANAIDTVVIVGDVEVVSQDIEDALEADGITVNRLGGATRYETAIEIAEFHTTVGFTLDEVVLARGDKFPDALAGGPLAASMMAPMVLTQSDVLTPATGTWLSSNCQAIDALTIMGGPAAIADAVVTAAQEAAQCDTAATLNVQPSDAASFGFQNEAGATPNADNRTYTVTGLDNTKTYDIALFPAANVSANGTFKDTDGTANVADGAGDTSVAEITNVNNAASGPGGSVSGVSPVNGTITFVLDAVAPGSVVPVLWQDADNGNDLDLNASDVPTEPFGVGGTFTVTAPAAASSADATDGRVGTLDKTGNTIGVDTATAAAGDYSANAVDVIYTYDSNDSFAVGGIPATIDEFEAQLSRGDGLSVGAYSTNSALVSVFNISADSPVAPTVTAAAGTGASSNDITVTIAGNTITTEALYSTFTIQRALSSAPTAWSTIATVAGTADASAATADFQYVDNNVAAGTYIYRALGTIDGDSSPYSTATANVTSTAPGPDLTAPVVIANGGVVDVDASFDNILDTGDTLVLHFSEPVQLSNPGLVLSDGADSGALTTANATFTLNTTAVGPLAPGQVLTVVVNAPVVEAGSGDIVGAASYTVANRAGITDASGNAYTLTGSDNTLEDDGPEMAAAVATNATTVIVYFNEPVSAATVAAADFAFDADGAGVVSSPTDPSAVTVAADGRSATLTVTGAVSGSSTVAIDGDITDTDGQTTATQAAITVA